MDSNSTYLIIINSMLTLWDILLVSALLARFQPNFPPPLADLTWCWFPIIPSALFELTIPTNNQQHLLAARARKEDQLAVYIMTFSFLHGLSVNLISIEIGCLGHFMPDAIAQVANVCEMTKKTVRSLFEQTACIAVSCLYMIFNSRAGSISLPKLNFSACHKYYFCNCNIIEQVLPTVHPVYGFPESRLLQLCCIVLTNKTSLSLSNVTFCKTVHKT